MRVFLLGPNLSHAHNWGWQHFRDEIARQHEIVGFNDKFDILISDLSKYCSDIADLEKSKVPKVYLAGDYFDYHPQDSEYYTKRQNDYLTSNKFDAVFFKTLYEMTTFKHNQIQGKVPDNILSFHLPYSVDTNIYKPSGLDKIYDVAAMFTDWVDWCYPNRKRIKKILKELLLVIKLGDKKAGPIHEEYIRAINQSKIMIGSCNIFGNSSWRIHETLACGTFFLTDRPYDLEILGYKDGEHLVIYEGLEDLKEKIKFYLLNDAEREAIAERGMEYCREHHSNEVRVKQMFKILEELYGENT